MDVKKRKKEGTIEVAPEDSKPGSNMFLTLLLTNQAICSFMLTKRDDKLIY